MASMAAKTDLERPFIPIYLDSLRVDTVLEFDLYINVNRSLVLYRSADLPFTDRTRQKLLENKVERLYISSESRAKYQRYMEKNLGKVLTDPDIQEEKRPASCMKPRLTWSRTCWLIPLTVRISAARRIW